MLQKLISGGGKIFGEAAKRTLLAAITVPESIIMLFTAIIIDGIGLLLFILDFVYGIGIPFSFLLDFAGIIAIGSWLFIRPIYRGLTAKIVKGLIVGITGKVSKEISKMPTFRERRGSSFAPAVETAKKAGKVAKTGIKGGKMVTKLSLRTMATIGTIIVELVPFVGDIAPTWTLRVIYELVQGEV